MTHSISSPARQFDRLSDREAPTKILNDVFIEIVGADIPRIKVELGEQVHHGSQSHSRSRHRTLGVALKAGPRPRRMGRVSGSLPRFPAADRHRPMPTW